MSIYKRIETNQEIKFVYKTFYTYFIYAYIVLLALSAFIGEFGMLTAVIAVLMMLYGIVVTVISGSQKREISEAMKKGSVKVSGSKFSFSDPLITTIKK